MFILKTLLNKEYNKPIDKLKIALCFIIIFAIIYYFLDKYSDDCFTYFGHVKELNLLDCLYFSSTTQVTIGYGDILPNSYLAKIVNFFHLMVMMYLLF